MSPTQSPRYADHSYGGTTYGSPPDGYTNAETPWAFGSTRVEGVVASAPLSPIVPGQSVTYECTFYHDPSEASNGHIQRARTLGDYLVYAPDVLTFDPPGQEIYFREQHSGPSSLLRIAPLQADHDATWVDGDPPPTRASMHYARWSVVVGGTLSAPVGTDGPATLELETVTIAAADDAAEATAYSTRDAVLAATERNGLS